jgi:hypothetical protein
MCTEQQPPISHLKNISFKKNQVLNSIANVICFLPKYRKTKIQAGVIILIATRRGDGLSEMKQLRPKFQTPR